MKPCISNWCWYIVIHLHNIIWQATKDIYTDIGRFSINWLPIWFGYWLLNIEFLHFCKGEHFNSIIRMDFCQWLWLIKLNIKQISPANPVLYFQLDKGIAALAPMFLDTVICEGLDYSMMSALSSCQLYTTTSTTPDPSHRGLSSSAWSLVTACPSLFPLLLLFSQLHQRWTSNNSWKTAFSFRLL